MNMRLTIVASLMLVSASAATAGTYTGNWPVTITHSDQLDGSFCLTLTDDGTQGWPHSGHASLPGFSYGTFQLIGQDLLVTIEEEGHIGQNAGWVFLAHAGNGTIGKGVTDLVFGGEAVATGVVVFGIKGRC